MHQTAKTSDRVSPMSNIDQNATRRSNMSNDISQMSQGAQKNRLQSPDFFKMSGMPKFGKQWLDKFIEDPELQNTFLTSEVVRNVLMLQCIFFSSVFNDLILYKQAFLL